MLAQWNQLIIFTSFPDAKKLGFFCVLSGYWWGKITKEKDFRWLFLFSCHVVSLSSWCKWASNECEKVHDRVPWPLWYVECDYLFLFLSLKQSLVHLQISIFIFYCKDISFLFPNFKECACFQCLSELYVDGAFQCCGNGMARTGEHMDCASPMLSYTCSLLQHFKSKLRPRKMT